MNKAQTVSTIIGCGDGEALKVQGWSDRVDLLVPAKACCLDAFSARALGHALIRAADECEDQPGDIPA